MKESFEKHWRLIAAIIGAVILVVNFINALSGNKTIATFALIFVSLVIIMAGMWKYAFTLSDKPYVKNGKAGFRPKYKYHWAAKSILYLAGFSIAVSVFYISTFIGFIPDCCGIAPTPTPTITGTPTSTFTPTSPPTPTPTTISDATYILIVLDASERMREPFDNKTKWDAALESVRGIIDGLDPLANYGLIVVGGQVDGSSLSDDGNPCGEPSKLNVQFTNRENVSNLIGKLQPAGGGSLYTAFNLANNQFREDVVLPPGAIGTIIYITGSSDNCDQNEWVQLERLFKIPGPGGVVADLYSEIIVIDNKEALTRTIQEQFESLSTNLSVQAPPSIIYIQETTNNTVISNVDNHIDASVEKIPPTPTFTLRPQATSTASRTLAPGVPTIVLPTSTNIPPTKTFTPTITKTSAPTFTRSSTPSPLPPPFGIISPGNISLGCQQNEDCMIPVTVQWISDTQAATQGLSLSIWVKPYPGDSNYLFYSQTPLTYQGNYLWTSNPVIVGQIGDPPGTPFAIYAIVTNQSYSTGVATSPLPAHSNESVIQVTR